MALPVAGVWPATGAALDMALGRSAGKRTGEALLLRGMLDGFGPGGVVLGDRYFTSCATPALLLTRGVHYVGRAHAARRVDFRRGVRRGRGDHIARWARPARPGALDAAAWAELSAHLPARECRVTVAVPGFCVRRLVAETTLLDADRYPVAALAGLYRARWREGLNLRVLKVTLGMGVLRCRTPAVVRKELRVHLLAYNLVRDAAAGGAPSGDDAGGGQLSRRAAGAPGGGGAGGQPAGPAPNSGRSKAGPSRTCG